MTDFGTEITNSVDRNGHGAIQGILNFGGFRANNIGDPVASQDVANMRYVIAQSQGTASYGVAAGTGDAITATITPAIPSLATPTTRDW